MKNFLRVCCILALFTSAAFAQDQALNMGAVQAQMSKLYEDALRTFVPTTNGSTRKAELSFTVNADGTPGPITSSGDWACDFLRVQQSDTAIVHTYPLGTCARPSDCDSAVAVKLGIPNYELSHYALRVAMPNRTSHNQRRRQTRSRNCEQRRWPGVCSFGKWRWNVCIRVRLAISCGHGTIVHYGRRFQREWTARTRREQLARQHTIDFGTATVKETNEVGYGL